MRIPPPQPTLTIILARQPNVESLSLHLPWFVHRKHNSKSLPTPFAYHTLPATLLLLLAISVLIVGRSIFIRRRARRMMEEAMRNGTLPPQTGRPSVKFGAKPKLFDVYTTRNGIPGEYPLYDSLLSWENLKVRSHFLPRNLLWIFITLQHQLATLRDVEKTGRVPVSKNSGPTTASSSRNCAVLPFSPGSSTPSNASGRYHRPNLSPS